MGLDVAAVAVARYEVRDPYHLLPNSFFLIPLIPKYLRFNLHQERAGADPFPRLIFPSFPRCWAGLRFSLLCRLQDPLLSDLHDRKTLTLTASSQAPK